MNGDSIRTPQQQRWDRLRAWLRPGSGPVVARLFHRLLAVVFLLAWISLGVQVLVLIGSRGLLPINEYVHARDLSFFEFPSVFIYGASDTALIAGIWIGAALSVAGLFGFYPRVCAGINAFLYLSYATACREFLWFQWDGMLIEAGVLAMLLPRDRPARWIHLLMRLFVFKVYFESGIAKWNSPIGDWHDGTAMAWYYETSPVPTWLAYYFHQLPGWWHWLESWVVLLMEVFGAFLIFGPRKARLFAFGVFTAFMLLDIGTSNYGFFCYLTLALHVFMLDDRDITWIASKLGRLVPSRVKDLRMPRLPTPRLRWAGPPVRKYFAAAFAAVWITASTIEGLAAFAKFRHADSSVRKHYRPFRVFNVYHLFASVTRARFEPTFETFGDDGWTEHQLHYKPGNPGRRPPFVAPHNPRVDFRLWFYGLTYKRGSPLWVDTLGRRLCTDPDAVQGLFATDLPDAPEAVRIQIYAYRFTDMGSDDWWHREYVETLGIMECDQLRPRN